ncbi:hypothetical protein CANCADRAFT_30146 [Tortispora caseinolytica NRRL Y-17796]|uniref:Uncharacterized protein n=1 Tax=Tortispora caseinolytica NRRL Y-17796 TaxID=767744 RepID=A0A1E4TJ71_9ASCO|nr:hypothetical protein CANCADRAFT_30146 [Tortispora caseinolytica NRRL Y-17796]
MASEDVESQLRGLAINVKPKRLSLQDYAEDDTDEDYNFEYGTIAQQSLRRLANASDAFESPNFRGSSSASECSETANEDDYEMDFKFPPNFNLKARLKARSRPATSPIKHRNIAYRYREQADDDDDFFDDLNINNGAETFNRSRVDSTLRYATLRQASRPRNGPSIQDFNYDPPSTPSRSLRNAGSALTLGRFDRAQQYETLRKQASFADFQRSPRKSDMSRSSHHSLRGQEMLRQYSEIQEHKKHHKSKSKPPKSVLVSSSDTRTGTPKRKPKKGVQFISPNQFEDACSKQRITWNQENVMFDGTDGGGWRFYGNEPDPFETLDVMNSRSLRSMQKPTLITDIDSDLDANSSNNGMVFDAVNLCWVKAPSDDNQSEEDPFDGIDDLEDDDELSTPMIGGISDGNRLASYSSSASLDIAPPRGHRRGPSQVEVTRQIFELSDEQLEAIFDHDARWQRKLKKWVPGPSDIQDELREFYNFQRLLRG